MIFGSAVDDDGVFLELNDTTGEGQQETLLVAFWSDADGSFTFQSFKQELPFVLVETFIREARKLLPPIKADS